jgi:hypothetical protein
MITKDNNIDDETVKAAIDDTKVTNGWCILAVDTSSSAYSDEALGGVIDYVKAQAGAEIVSTVNAVRLIEETINNQLDAVRDALNAHRQLLAKALYIESFDPVTGTLVTRSAN